MIPKKGQCIVRKYEGRSLEAGGLYLPERNAYRTDVYEVVAVRGGEGSGAVPDGLAPGSLVAFATNPSETVQVDLGEQRFFTRRLSDALAVVGETGLAPKEPRPATGEVPDLHVQGVGEKVVIAGAPISGTYRVGALFIPYTRREVGRLNFGPVVSLAPDLSERTGIVPGAYALYDYHSTYGHFEGFDVTNEENVIALLEEDELAELRAGRC